MTRYLEKIIAKLKGDPAYRLSSGYSTRQFLMILYYRCFQILRGFYKGLFISAKGLFFCGRNVRLEFGSQIKMGRNCILGDNVQLNALSEIGIKFGNNVTVASNTIMVCTGVVARKGKGIQIGNSSAIGAQSFFGGQGGIVIGDDVIMGPQVRIFSENHYFELNDLPIRKQGEYRKGVVIGNDCWVGGGVTILDGVEIGDGCVIAAGAVVTKSFPALSIIAGVPAKIVKSRNGTVS